MHCHASRGKSSQAAMLSAESCFTIKASKWSFASDNAVVQAVRIVMWDKLRSMLYLLLYILPVKYYTCWLQSYKTQVDLHCSVHKAV